MITFNGATKLIVLSATTELDVQDLWSRWVDWVATDDNSKFLPAFRSVGGDTIDSVAGTYIPVYTFMLNGWKIRPGAVFTRKREFESLFSARLD
jgi:hypothetical protein